MAGRFKGDTGVISLASLPTGRAVVMIIKTEGKMAAFLALGLSLFA